MSEQGEQIRLAGRLLVAAPVLMDPNFFRTVILVLEHTAEGAVGVVLNRPSDTAVGEPLPAWEVLAAEPAVVFVGGPVEVGSAIALARAAGDPRVTEAWSPVLGAVGTVDLGLDPVSVEPVIDQVRVFTGYAGWGPGQLESELVEGAWFVVDARPEDALSSQPDGLWPAVLRRQGGRLAGLAHLPVDPSLN